jgi:hypothetical protein
VDAANLAHDRQIFPAPTNKDTTGNEIGYLASVPDRLVFSPSGHALLRTRHRGGLNLSFHSILRTYISDGHDLGKLYVGGTV